MDLIVVLHTHLPFVMGHGRWPHGSDWLTEASMDCYLPFLDSMAALDRERVPAPVTLGVTPVLAAQLAMPAFAQELREFLAARLLTCDEAEIDVAARGETALVPVVQYWRSLYRRRLETFDALDGDMVRALRDMERGGQIELISSAATHGFLPLLGRDESIRLQLFAGKLEHKRLFGREASGMWLPECAYRPKGKWAPWPGGPTVTMREGIETFVREAGYRFTVVDSHLARAGRPLEAYGGNWAVPGAGVGGTAKKRSAKEVHGETRSAYRDYVIGTREPSVHALVRDPIATRQVWERDGGYPGGGAYLEFHKIRWPGGLKLWEVTGSKVPLGGKQPYDPQRARWLARDHANHFAGLLETTARKATSGESVIVAPFDSELFGHWWFEGIDFLADSYRALARSTAVRPVRASAHLRVSRGATPLDLPAGSWGRDGNFTMWLNPGTAWTWKRIWQLEERFWNAAPAALASPETHLVLGQAARELLLMQSSDWQFIISTGEVADYGERRFRGHAEALDWLIVAMESAAAGRGDLASATSRAEVLREQDSLFPDVLAAVAAALEGSLVTA